MPTPPKKRSNLLIKAPIVLILLFLAGLGLKHLLMDEPFTRTEVKVKPAVKPKKKIKLFDDSIVHRIDLKFDQANYWDQLLDHRKQADSLEITNYLPVDLTIDNTVVGEIGIRFKGESSFEFSGEKKKSFKLSFNKFDKKKRFQKITKLHLNNCFKDPTFMRDKLYLDMQDELGIPTQKSAFAKVYINNIYWGVYLMIEQIDKHFIKRNFNESKGTLFKGEPNALFTNLGKNKSNYSRKYQLKSKNPKEGWKSLIEFIQSLHVRDLSPETFYIQMDSKFEVDDCLRSWALNNALVNVDAYNMHYPHNFYIYQNTKDNKFNWINYDGNYSFGAWSPTLTYKQMVELPIEYELDSTVERPLYHILMDNAVCQAKYQNILKKEVLPLLQESSFNARVDEIKTLIAPAVYADSLKMYSNELFDQCIEQANGDKNDPGAFSPGIKQFTKERAEFLEMLTL